MVEAANKKLTTRPVTEESMLEFVNRELVPLVEKLRLITSQILERYTEGQGSPEGVVTADKAALYQQQDGAPGTLIWVKTTDGSKTGWVNVL